IKSSERDGDSDKANNADFHEMVTQDIDPAEMERAALLGQVGQPSEPWTHRDTEVPYTMPPDVRVATDGQPLNLDELKPNRRYLWIVTEDGSFLLAEEGQADFFPRRDRIEPAQPAAGAAPPRPGARA